VPFSEAAKLPLLLPSHHLGLRAVVNDAAIAAQAKLNIRMEADSARLTCDLLLAGLGYAMLPACYCREDPSLRLWQLTAPAPKLNIILASRKSSQITSALEDHLANIVTAQLAA
jgi:LysR family transcriptional regulator, nitrogen assimilation regulatory protein